MSSVGCFFQVCDYKNPPLVLQHSSTQNNFNSTYKHKAIMQNIFNILEEKQQPPEESIDKQKLRYIASQVTIWDYFGIP